MDQSTSSSKMSSDQSFWNEAFFGHTFSQTTSDLDSSTNNPANGAALDHQSTIASNSLYHSTTSYSPNPPTQDNLFELWCCSNELCLPFADQNGQICNISNCPSSSATCFDVCLPPATHSQPTSTPCSTNLSLTNSSNTHKAHQNPCCPVAPPQENLLDCDCCRAGCPPSPISLQPCIECDPPAQNLSLRASPSITTTTTNTTNRSDPKFLSPSLTSNLSRNDFDDFPANQPGHNDLFDDDTLWIDKDIEELIKCCCCDEPTRSEVLPTHHAHAHPTHHVNFAMFDRPSITFPYKSREQTKSISVTPSIPSFAESCNQGIITTFKCQWKDCNVEFSDRNKLAEHVNVYHLLQHSPVPNPGTLLESPKIHSPRMDHQRITPSDIFASQPEQSSPTSNKFFKARLDGLFLNYELPSASHLTFNHSSIDNQSNTSPLVRNEISPIAQYQSCFDLTSQSNDQLATTDGSPTRINHDDSNNQFAEDPCINPVPPSIISSIDPLLRSQSSQNPATSEAIVGQNYIHHQHVCRWDSCTHHAFASTAELTEHISTDHVGAGKSKYACLWEGCYCITNAKSTQAHEEKQERPQTDIARTDVQNDPSDMDNARKVFSQRQKLMRHLQTHTGDKPFECESCGKRFGEMTTLIQHRRTHTHEKPYKCLVEGCGKSFALQSALTIHKRTHTGSKPFKCPVKGCSAQFSESSNLSKHMRTHSLVKKFKCTICGKRFTRSDQLTRHYKSESIHLHITNNSAGLHQDDDDEEEEQEQENNDVIQSQGAHIDPSSALHTSNTQNRLHHALSGQETRKRSAHPSGDRTKRTKPTSLDSQ